MLKRRGVSKKANQNKDNMLNPILSNLSLTQEQIKNIEKKLNKTTEVIKKNMLVLLIDNSGQLIATNGNNTKNYDLLSISALSIATLESTQKLSEAMGQSFKYVFNQGTTSNLFITRATNQTVLVIDYDSSIEVSEVEKVVDDFSTEIKELSKTWSVVDKNKIKKGEGPLKEDTLDKDIDEVFNSLS